MDGLRVILVSFLSMGSVYLLPDQDNNSVNTSLTSEVAELKKTFKDQEQIHAALLTNVLTSIEAIKRKEYSTDRELVGIENQLKSKQQELNDCRKINTDLRNEVAQMQQTLRSLQAQEQKYGAVLSGVLSSISSIRYDYNLTERKFADVRSHLKEIENQTASSKSELSSLTAEQDGVGVCFEALLKKGYTIKNKGKIIFDNVTLNQGAGYDPLSGVFTAPVPGTYMFWAHVVLHDEHSKVFNVDISTSRGLLSRGYAKVTSGLTYNAVTPTVAAVLDKGEHVWFQVIAKDTAVLVGNKATSCGGTLLHVKQFV